MLAMRLRAEFSAGGVLYWVVCVVWRKFVLEKSGKEVKTINFKGHEGPQRKADHPEFLPRLSFVNLCVLSVVNSFRYAREKSARRPAPTFPVQPLYTPCDLESWDYDRQVGYPGGILLLRGVQATMHRGRLWTMRQYAGMGDAEESSKRYNLLANGTAGLSVALILPTQGVGLDSDTPLAVGEVGKVGVAVSSHRGPAAPFRWHRPDQDFRFDDHQRPRRRSFWRSM